MSKQTYVTKTLVLPEDLIDLSNDFMEEFGHDITDPMNFISLEREVTVDTFPVRIDVLVEMLNKMKRSGATHVQIDLCEEHIGYHFDALKVELTDENYAKKFMEEMESYGLSNPDDIGILPKGSNSKKDNENPPQGPSSVKA